MDYSEPGNIAHRASGNPVTIVAIMKKEQLFLQEWLDHHIALGVKNFILYNNDRSGYRFSTPEDVRVRLIDYSMQKGIGQTVQVQAYNDACKYLKGGTVAVIDLDEFIFITPDFQRRLDKRLPPIEAAFEFFNTGGLALSWMNIGAGGNIKRPAGGVVKNYTKPCPKIPIRFGFKSIYRVNQGITWYNAHRTAATPALFDTDGKIVTGYETSDLYDKVYIKHYITKSWEDYVEKLKRGNFSKGYRNIDTFFEYNPDMEHLREQLTAGLNLSEFPTINE